MRFDKKLFVSVFSALSLTAAVGCGALGGGDDDSDSEPSSDSSGSNLSTLGLTGTLNIEVPDAVNSGEKSGSSLRLSDAKKSYEACEIGQIVQQNLFEIQLNQMMLCMMKEANIPVDKKVKLTFPDDFSGPEGGPEGGPTLALQEEFPGEGEFPEGEAGAEGPGGDGMGDMDMRVWIDTKSVEGQTKVSFCNGDTLEQVITVANGGNKGSMKLKFDEFGIDLSYEIDGDKTTMNSKSFFGDDGQQVQMDLDDSGVSTIKVYSTHGGFEYNSVAKFDSDIGIVVKKFLGDEFSGEDSFASYFNGSGDVADGSGNAKFESGGTLEISEDDLLPDLSDTGADLTGEWDCKTDATHSLDFSAPTGEASCDMDFENFEDFYSCSGDTFEESDLAPGAP